MILTARSAGSGLEAVELGEGITEIPQYAFYNCLSLKQVTFPGSLVSVGDNAFGYSGLEELVLPDTVEVLGDYSFQSLQSAYAGCFSGGAYADRTAGFLSMRKPDRGSDP